MDGKHLHALELLGTDALSTRLADLQAQRRTDGHVSKGLAHAIAETKAAFRRTDHSNYAALEPKSAENDDTFDGSTRLRLPQDRRFKVVGGSNPYGASPGSVCAFFYSDEKDLSTGGKQLAFKIVRRNWGFSIQSVSIRFEHTMYQWKKVEDLRLNLLDDVVRACAAVVDEIDNGEATKMTRQAAPEKVGGRDPRLDLCGHEDPNRVSSYTDYAHFLDHPGGRKVLRITMAFDGECEVVACVPELYGTPLDRRTFPSVPAAIVACARFCDTRFGRADESAEEFSLPDLRIKPLKYPNPKDCPSGDTYGYFLTGESGDRAYRLTHYNDPGRDFFLVRAVLTRYFGKGPDGAYINSLEEVASRCGAAVDKIETESGSGGRGSGGWSFGF